MEKFDHVILGTGQATGTLLGKLIEEGGKIAVVEGGKIGGSCVNYGCTPTKTMVASAKAVHTARKGDFYGFDTGRVEVNYQKVRERMNQVRQRSMKGLESWMEGTSQVTLIREWGGFTGSRTIRAGQREFTGDKIYINTGTSPAVPPIEGIGQVPWKDSGGILDLEELPGHLLIIGGGYVGIEFAQVYRRLGSEVTLFQRGDQIMPKEDEDVAGAIREFLEEEGVEIHLGSNAVAVEYQNGRISLTVEKDGSRTPISGTHLLLATGRKPNTSRLGLDKAGIHTDERGYIQVDDLCRTSAEGVYALGDVNGRGAFTHTSVNDAEIVADLLFGNRQRKVSDRIPVYSLFSDPPLGRVGFSEKAALAAGKRVLKAVMPMSKISRANEMGETTGFAKLLVDADTDLVLGAAVLGPSGDEIINMFAAIMHSKIPCYEYRKVVLVHPTVSELMPWALDSLEEVVNE